MQQSSGLLLVPGSTGTTPLFSFPPGMKMQIESLNLCQKKAIAMIQVAVVFFLWYTADSPFQTGGDRKCLN
jgi:hypothetical protein